jgi:hypothetical protein
VAESAREKLLDWLERRAFNPVLRADPKDYPESRREALRRVQDKTAAERDRFRSYGSASEVVVNFKRDLTSASAQKVHRDLEELGLPTLNALQSEFEALADSVGARG